MCRAPFIHLDLGALTENTKKKHPQTRTRSPNRRKPEDTLCMKHVFMQKREESEVVKHFAWWKTEAKLRDKSCNEDGSFLSV